MDHGTAVDRRYRAGHLRPVRLLLSAAARSTLLVPAILLLLLVSIVALPSLYPMPPPVGGSVVDANAPILSPQHILGTDTNGNDILSRLAHGGRTSLGIALLANIIGLSIGGAIGAICAYRGGIVETIAMRFIDALLAIPALVMFLAVSQILKPTALNIAVTIGAFSAPAFARVARSSTLLVMREPYIMTAQLCGTRFWSVLWWHIAPAVAPSLLTFAVLGLGTVITIEGALSFLGFGVQPPAPSWGGMIYQGQQVLSASPRLVLLPSLLLFCTVITFNLISQRLRERWEE